MGFYHIYSLQMISSRYQSISQDAHTSFLTLSHTAEKFIEIELSRRQKMNMKKI